MAGSRAQRATGSPAPRRRRGAGAAALLAALLAAGLAVAAGAAEPGEAGRAPEADYAYELADELMSPFCPGRALSECPSPQAADLRAWIVEQDLAGVPRREVEAELYEVWGDALRQAPRPEGVGIAAYAIPAGLFAAGGGVLAFFWRRQRRRAGSERSAPAASLAPVDPELERALEEEIRRDEAAQSGP